MDRKAILIIILYLFVQTLKVQSLITRKDILNNLTSGSTYDSSYPAGYDEHIPTDVIVQLEITDVTSISEQKMEYEMMIYLRMQWRDNRLAFNDLANFTSIDLIGVMVDLIWTPDVYISNERRVDTHSFVKHEELAYINPNGTVTFSMRAAMTGNCQMNLNRYPFDEQICKIRFSSYTLTSDKLLLQWSENSVLAADIDLTNYKIEVDDHTEGSEKQDNRSLVGGEFSYLIASLKIVRRSKAYGSMYFAPFPVFFVIALCSFGFKDQGARVSLCTTSITTTVLQWIAIYSRLPPVWYFTYLDGWVIFHIVIIGIILIFHACWYLYVHTRNVLNHVGDPEKENAEGKSQNNEKISSHTGDPEGNADEVNRKSSNHAGNPEGNAGVKKERFYEPMKKALGKIKLEVISALVFQILYGLICVLLFIFWADFGISLFIVFMLLSLLGPIFLLALIFGVFIIVNCVEKRKNVVKPKKSEND